MAAVICTWCGVSHPQPQSHCNGCGGDLPPPEPAPVPPAPTRQRNLIVGAAAALVLLVVATVVANRLSGPQPVEIVSVAPGALGQIKPPDFEPGSTEHRYLMTANLSGAIAAISPLRMYLMEFRQMEGRYPERFDEVGLTAADLSDGRFVTSVSLREGGRLLASLDPSEFGDAALLELRPVDVMGGTQTRWECRTTVPDAARIKTPGSLPCPFAAEIAD